MIDCPLCGDSGVSVRIDAATARGYGRCPECDLRFLQPSDRLSPADERAHYGHHQNDIDDPRYQAFVAPVCDEVKRRVGPGGHGLDFGAGPGPALATLLRSAGYSVNIYDPIFAPDEGSLALVYDFVVASEVVEHFFHPLQEFQRLYGLLKESGVLVLMTLLVPDKVDFEKWYYRIDPTHAVFYSENTFEWIKRSVGFSRFEMVSPRLIVLTK